MTAGLGEGSGVLIRQLKQVLSVNSFTVGTVAEMDSFILEHIKKKTHSP